MNNKQKNLFSSRANTNSASVETTLRVNKSRCPQNHSCPAIRACPVEALSQKGYSAPEADMKKCIKCGKCIRFCPMRALSLG